jgi:hypothetical protein
MRCFSWLQQGGFLFHIPVLKTGSVVPVAPFCIFSRHSKRNDWLVKCHMILPQQSLT